MLSPTLVPPRRSLPHDPTPPQPERQNSPTMDYLNTGLQRLADLAKALNNTVGDGTLIFVSQAGSSAADRLGVVKTLSGDIYNAARELEQDAYNARGGAASIIAWEAAIAKAKAVALQEQAGWAAAGEDFNGNGPDGHAELVMLLASDLSEGLSNALRPERQPNESDTEASPTHWRAYACIRSAWVRLCEIVPGTPGTDDSWPWTYIRDVAHEERQAVRRLYEGLSDEGQLGSRFEVDSALLNAESLIAAIEASADTGIAGTAATAASLGNAIEYLTYLLRDIAADESAPARWAQADAQRRSRCGAGDAAASQRRGS